MPLSTPPVPSELPKLRILGPLTGIGSSPFADAKAMAGASRPGSFSAAAVFLASAFAFAVSASFAAAADLRRRLEILFHLRDQVAQAVGLPGQLDGAAPLRLHVLFRVALPALPLVDQRREPLLVGGQAVAVGKQPLLLFRGLLADADEVAEIADQPFGARAHLRHHRAEQHRRAQRLQRVLGPHHQRRRRATTGALQRGQHLGGLGAARVERVADGRFALVEGAQPLLGLADTSLDGAHARGDIDQLTIELVAVLADRGDLGLELDLGLDRIALPVARLLELLLVLLDDVLDRRGLRRSHRPAASRPRYIRSPAPARAHRHCARLASATTRSPQAACRMLARKVSFAVAAIMRSRFRRVVQGLLRAMIGVAGQNRRRPINLLHQHDPHQLMGPGRRAEGEHCLDRAPQFGRKSVRSADHEYNVRGRFVSPSAELFGESWRCRPACPAHRARRRAHCPGSGLKSPRLRPPCGLRPRGRGFRVFRESRGRGIRACGQGR